MCAGAGRSKAQFLQELEQALVQELTGAEGVKEWEGGDGLLPSDCLGPVSSIVGGRPAGN